MTKRNITLHIDGKKAKTFLKTSRMNWNVEDLHIHWCPGKGLTLKTKQNHPRDPKKFRCEEIFYKE